MKRKAVIIGVLLLLSVLVASAPQLFGEKTVKALNAAVIYSPNYWVGGVDYGDELTPDPPETRPRPDP